MSRANSYDEDYEPKNRPVFETDYEFCSACERRINKVLFEGHSSCAGCRGKYDEPDGQS